MCKERARHRPCCIVLRRTRPGREPGFRLSLTFDAAHGFLDADLAALKGSECLIDGSVALFRGTRRRHRDRAAGLEVEIAADRLHLDLGAAPVDAPLPLPAARIDHLNGMVGELTIDAAT